jgi:hypothetical protein
LKHAASWAYPTHYAMLGGMMPLHPMMYAQFGMPMAPPSPPAPRLKKLDCYQLDLNQQIGTGFSSVVYKATDTRNNEEVCIKALIISDWAQLTKPWLLAKSEF